MNTSDEIQNNTNKNTMQVKKDEQAPQDVIMYSELAAMDLEIDSDDEKVTHTLNDNELENEDDTDNTNKSTIQVDKDEQALQDVIMYGELAAMGLEIDSDDENKR